MPCLLPRTSAVLQDQQRSNLDSLVRREQHLAEQCLAPVSRDWAPGPLRVVVAFPPARYQKNKPLMFNGILARMLRQMAAAEKLHVASLETGFRCGSLRSAYQKTHPQKARVKQSTKAVKGRLRSPGCTADLQAIAPGHRDADATIATSRAANCSRVPRAAS